VVLEKTLESPLDCKEIQPVHPKGDQSWVLFGRMMLKLKFQYFGHFMQKVDSLEKTLMLGGDRDIRERKEGCPEGSMGPAWCLFHPAGGGAHPLQRSVTADDLDNLQAGAGLRRDGACHRPPSETGGQCSPGCGQ